MTKTIAAGAAGAAAAAAGDLLTPSEVAVLFNVNPKTVTRWARAGLISTIRTPGGHRRFLAKEIAALAVATKEAG